MLVYKNNFDSVVLGADFVEEFSNLPLFKYLNENIDFNIYEKAVKQFENFENVIHLGTGGSSLGPQALFHALPGAAKKFYFFDNIDPITFVEKLQKLDFAKTGVIVASKSGNTAETLVQLATVVKLFKQFELNFKNHFIVICQTDGNALHEFALNNGITVIAHNPLIGGRFAVFAEIGVLPGLMAGFDMRNFCKGASDAWQEFVNDSASHPATLAANYLAQYKLHPVNFIYSEKLKLYGAWFSQLWAESLGKTDNNGKRFGTIPICALGAVDQHSQLQLYLGGLRDKFFTFIECLSEHDLKVDDLNLKHAAYSALKGKTLKDLYKAELMATYTTMCNHNLPLRLVTIDRISTYNLGWLMLNAVLETLITAKIWGVNAFDQPAVEEGKILALQFLNK